MILPLPSPWGRCHKSSMAFGPFCGAGGVPGTLSMRRRTPEERFMKKFEGDPATGCWNWIRGCFPQGYGRFSLYQRSILAHRFSYEMFVGPIPEGLTLDHVCRNRRCVNPDHLEPVTNHENILRGTGPTAVNAAKTHCVHGHPFDGQKVIVDKLGHRHCRTCREELRKGRPAPVTHCRRGHPFDAENTTHRPDGSRRCRTCFRMRERRRYEARNSGRQEHAYS